MAYRTIQGKGPYRYEEATTYGTVYPGMLVMLNSSGLLIPHNEEGGRGEVAFAIEDALQGRPVATAYTSGTVAGYILPAKGSEVQARLATSQVVAIGDELVSNGSGYLEARGSSGSGVTEWQTIGYAMEAKTSTSNDLIRIRVA